MDVAPAPASAVFRRAQEAELEKVETAIQAPSTTAERKRDIWANFGTPAFRRPDFGPSILDRNRKRRMSQGKCLLVISEL